MGERLVLLESFEELRTGMRVVVDCLQPNCTIGEHVGLLGAVEFAAGLTRGWSLVRRNMMDLIGVLCCGGQFAVDKEAVDERLVRRFAEDIDSDAQLAAESNPYLERSAVGTGGRDEVRVAAKERTR